MNDWIGNQKSMFTIIGADGHSETDREEHDYYATPPQAVEHLVNMELFNNPIWECACGEGHISKVLLRSGYAVTSTDLIDRGFGIGGWNFLTYKSKWPGDIITNPPYSIATKFVLKALLIIPDGNKVAMFLKLTFLESKERKYLFTNYPPQTVYVSRSRLRCAKNGIWRKDDPSSAVSYAWFVWVKGYKDDTILKWFN